jgi:hypothetical protein
VHEILKQFEANKNLFDLENAFKKMPQAGYVINNHFSEGVYVRERLAKADTLIIGKRHRHQTTSILLAGCLSVYNEETDSVKHIQAPAIWVTEKYAKRMTYSHTDTILATVHPTEETDLEKIEEEFTIPEEEYKQLAQGDHKCLG